MTICLTGLSLFALVSIQKDVDSNRTKAHVDLVIRMQGSIDEEMNHILTRLETYMASIGLDPPITSQTGSETVLQLKSIERIFSGKTQNQRLELMATVLKTLGMILVGGIVSAALFSLSLAVKTGLLTRRDELEILSILGATPGFLKLPFFLEGILLGICSAGTVALIMGPIITLVQSHLSLPLAQVLVPEVCFSFSWMAALYLAGIGFGALGAWLGLRSFEF